MMVVSEAYLQLATVLRSLTPIPEQDLQSVLAKFTPLRLEQGQYFLHADEIPHRLGFIVSGLLRMFYLSMEGEEFTKSFCIAPEFVTSYSAMILREPSHLSIRAEQPTVLLTMEFDPFNQALSESLWWQILTRRLVKTLYIKKERRERELLLDDATTRYQRFLAEYPQVERRVKQYQVASYLGITPVSLSRIRAQLQKLS